MARAFYGDSFVEVVEAASQMRVQHAPQGRKSTAYKRKLGRKAATLAVIESLQTAQSPVTNVGQMRVAAKLAAHEVPRERLRTLLSVESGGPSPTWVDYVTGLAESVAYRLQRTSGAIPTASASSYLLHNTEEALRKLIESRADLRERVRQLELRTSFVLLPRTSGGKRFLDRPAGADVKPYLLDEAARERAAMVMREAGATVVYHGKASLTIESSARTASKIVGHDLRIDVSTVEEGGWRPADVKPQLLYVRPTLERGSGGKPLQAAAGEFVFVPPPIPAATVSASQPSFSHPHLTHQQVRDFLGVGRSCMPWTGGGSKGGTDQRVKVALVDTGCDPRHPIFGTVGAMFSYVPTNAGPTPRQDTYGHGTAMAWCVLMSAPNVEIISLAHGDQADQALDAAWREGADIVCCPWQMPYQGPGTWLEGLIETLIDDGHIVLAAAGNGQPSWPGDMPRVISVGGVYADALTQDTRPSTYTSWYESVRYKGRVVPDVCGIAGDLPRGVFLPLPCPPQSVVDVDYGIQSYANGDGLATDDGWIFASGSSAATAQVAGVVALLVEKAKDTGVAITQLDVKHWLKIGSIPIKTVNNSLFSSSSATLAPPKHPGLVNGVASLSLV